MARQRLTAAGKPAAPPARDWAAISFLEFSEQIGVELTEPQSVLCEIAFDGAEPGDLEGERYEIAQRLLKPPGQAEPVLTIPPAARRVLTLVKGARIGGTYISALYAAYRSLRADLSTLAPGELGRVIFGAPDLDLAGQALTYAAGAFQSHPELERLMTDPPTASRFSITRPHDGREVEFVTRAASRGGRSFRSRSLVCACLTEVAFFLSGEAVVNDQDCFDAVNPRVLPGGLTILESTAYAEAGLLFEEFDRNWGRPTTSLAVHAPTMLMLPSERNRLVYEAMLQTNPENAAREFGGQFIQFGSTVHFPREVIIKAKRGTSTTSAPGPGELAAVGGDLGLTSDAAAFCAVHRIPAPPKQGGDERRDPKTDRFRVVEMVERKPQRGTPLRLADLVPLGCALASRHGQKSLLVDQWSLQPAREHLPAGFSLDTANTDEAEMYDAVLELMKQGLVEIPAEFEALLRQLPLVHAKPLPGGGKKIILPRKFGSHCDQVPAFVKAVWRAKQMQIGATVSQPTGLRPRAMSSTGGF